MLNTSSTNKTNIKSSQWSARFATCLKQAKKRLELAQSFTSPYRPRDDDHSFTYFTDIESMDQYDKALLESIYFVGFLSTTCMAVSTYITQLKKDKELEKEPDFLNEYDVLMCTVMTYYMHLLELPSDTDTSGQKSTILSLNDIATFHTIASDYHNEILIPYLHDNGLNPEQLLLLPRNLTRYFSALNESLKRKNSSKAQNSYTAEELIKFLEPTRKKGNPSGVIMEWHYNRKAFLRFKLTTQGSIVISPEELAGLTFLQPNKQTEEEKRNQKEALRKAIASNQCLRVTHPEHSVRLDQKPTGLGSSSTSILSPPPPPLQSP